MKMKAVLLTVGSFILTAGVISNAYIQKKQFYPSVVFITKSSPSMAVLYIQAFVFVVLMWKLMRKMFFGQLRAAEMEHLIERSWYAVTETCLAFTVFRDDFSPRFVALFTLLLFIKCFHWLGEDRVDYMERSPVISLLFHMRVLSLLTVLGMMDAYFINHAYYSTLIKGASVQLVFGFEYAILLTVVLHIFIKYVLHAIDLQSENPWDNKAVYLLYTELLLGLIKVVLYMLFLAIMIKVHTFPLFAIRPMYLTMRTFKKAFNDVIMSRRAIRNMNTLYPNATAEELAAGDNVCIICREEMVAGNCKKLPCNHIFHSSCLRSWFQRQQTCPTCRMDVLRPPAPATPAPAPAAPAAQGPAQQQQQQQQQQPMAPMFPGFPPMFPAQAPPPTPPAASAATTTASGTTSSSAVPPPMSPPFMMPPMPFMMPPSMPFMGPMPSVPADLSSLSEEELAAMEGTERANVEARIQWLRNIHTLLDTAMAQLNQYSLVMASAAATQRGPSTTTANTTTVTATKTAPTPAETVTSTSTKESSAAEKGAAAAATAGEESLEGAVGGVEPSEPANPLADPPPPASSQASKDDDGDERSEIRRRRLERFSSSTSGGTQDKDNGASAGDASSAKQRTGGGNLDIAVD